jgi:hypothetical protein
MPDFKSRPTLDAIYLRFIRRQPCCICGNDIEVEAHHPRVPSINGGDNPGMAQKASDRWALPLCGRHHREAHVLGDGVFWKSYGLDPFALAMHYHADVDDDPLVRAIKDRGRA